MLGANTEKDANDQNSGATVQYPLFQSTFWAINMTEYELKHRLRTRCNV